MKYLDTNVLIRLITNDIPELAQQAIEKIESTTNEIMLFNAVITEVCFVLEFNQSYQLPRSVIYDGICAVLDSSPRVLADTYMREALSIYVSHPKLDYVDCLLLAASGGKKADLLTFDRALLRAAK